MFPKTVMVHPGGDPSKLYCEGAASARPLNASPAGVAPKAIELHPILAFRCLG